MSWPHQFSCLLSFSCFDLTSGGPFPQYLKNTLKPEVRDPHIALGASLGTLYHKGRSQVRELAPQPAAKDSLASSYLGSGTAATLSWKKLICGSSLFTLRLH